MAAQFVYEYDVTPVAGRRNRYQARWIEPMQCPQCEAYTAKGPQCSRNVCFGLPVCAQHAKSEYHVRRQLL